MNIFAYMKRLLLFLLILLPSIGYTQNEEVRQKIQTAKIAMISERLGLTPNEAEKFWPVYNEYSQKRRANQMEFSKARKSYNATTASEKETQEILKLGRNIKSRQLDLEHEYSNKMLNVIDAKQLMSLQNAERDFKRMLLDKLEQRRTQQQNTKDQMKQQNNERMRNKRN